MQLLWIFIADLESLCPLVPSLSAHLGRSHVINTDIIVMEFLKKINKKTTKIKKKQKANSQSVQRAAVIPHPETHKPAQSSRVRFCRP